MVTPVPAAALYTAVVDVQVGASVLTSALLTRCWSPLRPAAGAAAQAPPATSRLAGTSQMSGAACPGRLARSMPSAPANPYK